MICSFTVMSLAIIVTIGRLRWVREITSPYTAFVVQIRWPVRGKARSKVFRFLAEMNCLLHIIEPALE